MNIADNEDGSLNLLKVRELEGGNKHKAVPGTLTLHIASCSGLIPADSSGNSDPYVAARLGDKTKKSKVAKKTLDPEFGEELSFTIEDASTAEEVVLTVMDKDHGAKDDFLGDVHISLADVFLENWETDESVTAWTLGDKDERMAAEERKKLESRIRRGSRGGQPYGSISLSFSFVKDVKAQRLPARQEEEEEDAEADDGEEDEEGDASFWSWCAEKGSEGTQDARVVVEEVVENQRNCHVLGASQEEERYAADALLYSERGEWSDAHGQPRSAPEDGAEPPAGWVWLTSWGWNHDAGDDVDGEGWSYCREWSLSPSLWHTNAQDDSDVRRRRWYRLRGTAAAYADLAPSQSL